MNHFFSSDHHFFHDRIIEFTRRPFENLEQMHEALIEDHNAVVKPNDHWYCLGDVSFASDPEKTRSVLKRMNGQKFLVLGNHDHKDRLKGLNGSIWQWIRHRAELHVTGGPEIEEWVVMDHFPLMSWHRSHYNSYMLHGHSHGTMEYLGHFAQSRIMDVGVDALFRLRGHYQPIEFSEVRQLLGGRNNRGYQRRKAQEAQQKGQP